MVDKINELVQIYKDDEMVTDIIRDLLVGMNNYVYKVNEMETLKILRITIDSDVYKERFQLLDKARSNIHNGIIRNIKLINKICREDGYEVLYNGDEENRYEIGDFTGEIIHTIFINRKR